ncbi:DUF2851 family protein [Aequorivita sp. H23M31]|uniref:DUF2851 family protein n=1 Tax=Aequorivita ciconiae TaxID=2494375 RepID=A0A410G6P7_9FLAO|nr:DUF2851 family protein [Aequorivita sp. H23M31]QAA82942.1 DUF2851 family protein [Aequorivita sp. H23M31]
MKEDFLHYVWKFQKLDNSSLNTSNGEKLQILSPGIHNLNAGPDFFNAQIEIDKQLWAGNLEIHVNSSDWYAHGHESDPAYDNVILHVVWEHDAKVFRKDGSSIPTLALKTLVQTSTLERYGKLFSKEKKWINCENDFAEVDSLIIENWLERLYIERLQMKEAFLLKELNASNNHWEELLFRMLCKNFGLNINGESFFSIAKSIDFSVLKKSSQNQRNLEALLLGQAGLLEDPKEDGYFQILKEEYDYLKRKFKLHNEGVITPGFFRLRPTNFPTIRLSQLAALYFMQHNLFSHVVTIQQVDEFYSLLKISASDYWDTHFNFGVLSKESKKRITKSFMDLLVINTFLPIKFCYAKQQGQDVSEEILKIALEIPSEKNGIIDKFNSLKNISKNAYHGQALLQLKKEYCDKNRCLQCAIGNSIVNRK